MITKLLLKNTDVNGALILNMASSFYKDVLEEGENYTANEKTGLNYFGEYLERHEDRGVSVIEIMAATCLRKDEELPELQLFDGQYELFTNRVDKKISDLGFNFELEVLYAMFLIKTKKENKGKDILKHVLSNMTLDNKFLVLTGLVMNSYIDLDDECIKIIADRLKNTKIKLNVNNIISRFKEGKHHLDFESEYVYLKNLLDIYGFKKANFKEYASVFQSLKNLKKIGTREGIYSMYSNVLEVTEDEFYLISLKIAADFYIDGVSLGRTNEFLIGHLEKSLKANCEWYYELQYLDLRSKSKRYSIDISFKYMDFSNVEENFFDSLIKAFANYRSTISYTQIEDVCKNNKFIDYIKLKEKPLKVFYKNFILKVIKYENEFTVKEKYYDIVKDHEDLSSYDICFFCKEKLVSCEYILKKVISENKDGLSIEYNSREIISSCVEGGNFDILIKLIENLITNNVSIDRYVRGSLMSVSKYLEMHFNAKGLEHYNKNELMSLLNDFNFMYLSEDYNAFVIRNINNDIFKETLELDESDILEIANYLKEKMYISRENKNVLKKIVLSEDDLFLESLSKDIEEYLSEYRYNRGHLNIDDSLIKLIVNYNNKEVAISYINKVIEELSSSNLDDIKFFGLIKLILKTNLFKEDEVLNVIKNRLFEPVLY